MIKTQIKNMKKFEDFLTPKENVFQKIINYFRKPDVISTHKITPEQRRMVSETMEEFNEKHRPGIRKDSEYMPVPGGRGYFTKDYKMKIK